MDRIKENSKAAFDQQAAVYDKDIRGQHARSLYPILLERLARISFQSALDLGCGTGEMMKRILDTDGSKRLYGIDLSERMLETARTKLGERAALVLGDSEFLPFPDHFFDVVYCNDSFHHYPAPEKVLKEVRRVLKAGGAFLLGDCWQPPGARMVVNFYMRHSKEGDVKIYSRAEMVSLLSRQFHDVSWERVGGSACIAMGTK